MGIFILNYFRDFLFLFIWRKFISFREPPSNTPAKLIVGMIVETIIYAVITFPLAILVGFSLWKTNNSF